jgi:hypothetical protein
VPAALVLHNLEEALTIGDALPRLEALWARWAGHAVALPTEQEFQRALLLLTLAVGALYLAARVRDDLAYALVIVQAVMTLNVATHVIAAVLLRGYAPGVATALLVEAPTSFHVLRCVREGGWMTTRQWGLLPLLALLLHGPGLLALLLGVGA